MYLPTQRQTRMLTCVEQGVNHSTGPMLPAVHCTFVVPVHDKKLTAVSTASSYPQNGSNKDSTVTMMMKPAH